MAFSLLQGQMPPNGLSWEGRMCECGQQLAHLLKAQFLINSFKQVELRATEPEDSFLKSFLMLGDRQPSWVLSKFQGFFNEEAWQR